jgi:hypothetical protein
MLFLCILKLNLSLFHIVVSIFQVGFNIIKHLSLSLYKYGKFLEKLKELINILLESQNIFVFVLDVIDRVLYLGMDAHTLADHLLLEDLLGSLRVSSQLIKLLFCRIFFCDFKLTLNL